MALGDMKVGNIMRHARRRQNVQNEKEPVAGSAAHQSKREDEGYEFQEYMESQHDSVRENSEKAISIKCDRRENATRIMEIVESKTLIPRKCDKKTIEENNIEAGATIEMCLRTMGGMPEAAEDIKKGSFKI